MKAVIKLQTIFCILGTAILLVTNASQEALSFLFGSTLMLANVAVLAVVWWHILNKKLIALAVSIIVLKYAFIAILLMKVLSRPDVSTIWFCLGLATLLPTVVIYSVGVKCRA